MGVCACATWLQVIGPIRRLLQWSAVEAAHWDSASSASSTGVDAENSSGRLYSAWETFVLGAGIGSMKNGETLNSINNNGIFPMEDSTFQKEGNESRVDTSVAAKNPLPAAQPLSLPGPDNAQDGVAGRQGAVGTASQEATDAEPKAVVENRDEFENTSRQPGLVEAAVALLAHESLEQRLLVVAALSELCKRSTAEVSHVFMCGVASSHELVRPCCT